MYYLQSRYYDPAVGRFVNADSQITKSLGNLGTNIFSYCLNNPINNIDHLGNIPVNLFDSMDEAAKHFANQYNEKSITENREYATYIHTVTVTDAPPLIIFLLSLIGADSIINEMVEYKYTYVTPNQGGVDSATVPINWFKIHNVVSVAHTHGAYLPRYDNDNFSPADKSYADKRGIPIYVATPIGTLRRYDPSNQSDIVIYEDVPFDPFHPNHIRVSKNEK